MEFLKPGTTVKALPAAPIETFARSQAGILSSEDFHGIMDFHSFWGMDVWKPGTRVKALAAPTESFARFQAGLLSSDDFHRIE